MRKQINNLLCGAVVLLGTIYSCAVQPEVDNEGVQDDALKAWVALNRPDMTEYEDGLYMKFYSSTGEEKEPSSDTVILSTDWFEVTYRAQTLDNNYYYNMYPALGDTLGQYTKFNNYVPELVNAENISTSLSSAQLYALSKMVEADSVDIISAYRYVSSGNIGSDARYAYMGNVIVQASNPVYIRMRLNNIITDMYAYERNLVRDYATKYMGKQLEDTVKGVSLMYMEKLIENPKGDSVSQDTTVTLYYSGQLIDGFLFDTNVEEVAEANHQYLSSKSYEPIDFSYSSSTSTDGTTGENSNGFIAGFTEAVKTMRVGEKARFVFTSNLGYGDAGNYSSDMQYDPTYTIIPPKAPLVFTIEVIEEEEE